MQTPRSGIIKPHTLRMTQSEISMPQKIVMIVAFFFLLSTAGITRDAYRSSGAPHGMLSTEFADLSVLPEGTYVLSPYDNIIRHISEGEGNDWRLVSAIAYHESRFHPERQSRRGAWGLMQIMPSVAKQFGVDPARRGDLSTNILLANKLLHRLKSLLKFSDEATAEDRLSLLLAAYNGGYGHVSDARRLAEANGESADSWTVVAHYLALKADSIVCLHEAVRHGTFSGAAETTAYVADVRDRYAAYCRRAKR